MIHVLFLHIYRSHRIFFNYIVETVKQLEIKLSTFAKRHHKAIQNDPAFRHKFLSMCAPLGVDPLTTNKSFWSFLKMGDFYYGKIQIDWIYVLNGKPFGIMCPDTFWKQNWLLK